jgi:Homoserine dehydrogenase, NAD binding domain
MRMAAVYNRRPQRAAGVYTYAGCREVVRASNQEQLDRAIRQGLPAVAEDPFTICRSPEIDVLVDVTGSVEFGAHVVLDAFHHGKSVVLMNAELDATIGYGDVELPKGRLADRLRAEQYRHFRGENWLEEHLRGPRAGRDGVMAWSPDIRADLQ